MALADSVQVLICSSKKLIIGEYSLVIAYHEVEPEQHPYIYSVTCKQLESHFEILAERAAVQAPVKVTFDDGHISHYRYALPLLEKYRIKAAFCVTASWVGNQPAYMNTTQLRDLISLGHEVYAHGWSHKMMTCCSPSELYDELRLPKIFLEDALGIPVIGISFPHGRWNDRVLKMCGALGYQDVYNSEPLKRQVFRFGVRLTGRTMMTRSLSAAAFESLLSGGPKRRGHLKTAAKAMARAALGETRYRKLWRMAGSKKEPLPAASNLASDQQRRFYGAESMLLNLATASNEEGCRNIVGAFRNLKKPNTEIAERSNKNGLVSELITCRGRMDTAAVGEIRDVIYKHGIDIVHTHGCKANMYGWLAASRLGVPIVATCHMAWPDRSFALRLYHSLDRLILRRFQKVITVSDPIAMSLRRFGVRDQKLTTIPNGIDITPFSSYNQNRQAKAGGDERFVIGLVGRLIPCKGHRYLMQAVAQLTEKFQNICCLFVGDGPEMESLNRIASELQLKNKVTFAGKQEDMPGIYSSIDVLVLPSLSEGMPMTLIEGMAAGCPVIASEVGDIPKLIKHGETGLLVKPGNAEELAQAISQLISDPIQRGELALRGQNWVSENFSARTMAQRYRDVYVDILRTKSTVE